MQTAFALAGLGGFNAHGAGFLQAARDNDYWPDLVTATSGQILVLADYLAREPDLRRGLIDRNLARSPAAQLNIAWFGYPGVFAPAYGAALSRFSPRPRWATAWWTSSPTGCFRRSNMFHRGPAT